MYYANHVQIKLGNRVKLGQSIGVVAAVISENLYENDYLELDWSYLREGFLVNFEEYGLIYYKYAEQDLEFVERRGM